MRVIRRPLALAGLAGAVAFAAPAPPPVKAPAVEKVVVRLAQFDVVVRDKEGKLIRGLEAKDFVVLEDGSPLDVVAVDSWESLEKAAAAEPAPASPEPVPEPQTGDAPSPTPAAPKKDEDQRAFLILFDNLNASTAMRLTQAKRAATRFVRENLRANDLAAVYTLDHALRPISPFSTNPEETVRAVEKVAWFESSTFSEQIAESILAYQSESAASRMQGRLQNAAPIEGGRLDWTRQHVYRSLASLAEVFHSLPGRRVLVLVSAGFPMTAPGDVERLRGGFTNEFRDLVKAMGRSGVAVYTIDVGDDLAMGDVKNRIDWRVAVGKLGMDESFMADLGFDSAFGTGSASSRREFLGVLANETGGRMLTSNDLNRAFETIQEDTANYYRVSCRVREQAGDARYRRIVVKVRGIDDARVTARRGRYSDVTPNPSSAGTAASDRIERYARLLLRTSATTLPAPSDKSIPVAIVAEVVGPVVLAPDTEGAGRVELDFVAVARVAGEVVGRYSRRVSVRVRPEGLEAVRRGFRVEGRIDLPAGIYDLQTTVRLEEPAQLAMWSGPIAVPPPGRGTGLRFAGAILARESEPLPLLAKAELKADAKDALALPQGLRLLPPVDPAFQGRESALVLFWLEGLPVGDAPPRFTMDVTAVGPEGATSPLPGGIVFFEPDGERYRGVLRASLAGLAPGAWQIRVAALGETPEARAEARLPIVVEAAPTSSSP
ncbi:MAG TPA: VWA domain-containing protein [Candidatus Polarisedimenticolaceae bacterium]